MSYVYKKTESNLWTVGFYEPSGNWIPESDHGNPQDAAERSAYLNGRGQVTDAVARSMMAADLKALQDGTEVHTALAQGVRLKFEQVMKGVDEQRVQLLDACRLFLVYCSENCQTGQISWDQVRKVIEDAVDFALGRPKVQNTEVKSPGPMRCSISMDWCTYTCPCGKLLCTRFESDDTINHWIEEHKPHTNGKVHEHTNADGQRAWGGPVPDLLKDLK